MACFVTALHTTEPAGVAEAFWQLSLTRALATSAGYWGGIMACGGAILFLLDR